MMWFDLREGDKIRIGENVVLRVEHNRSSLLRLSIEAPQVIAVTITRLPRASQTSVAPAKNWPVIAD